MKATKHGVPWILIHSESFATRREAVQRELYYKTGRGRDDLNTIPVERSPRRQVAGSNPVAPISRLRVGVCYKRRCNDPDSARVSGAGFRVSRKRTL